MYPFIDLDSGGSVAGLIAAVDRMLAIADDKTRIIPGHGKVTDRAGLAAYREMLVVTSARVRDLVKAGKITRRNTRGEAERGLRRDPGLVVHHRRALPADPLSRRGCRVR